MAPVVLLKLASSPILCFHDLSLSQSLFSRSLRSTICNSGHPHPMRTLRITNGGPERAEKPSLGEREGRSCKHRIAGVQVS